MWKTPENNPLIGRCIWLKNWHAQLFDVASFVRYTACETLKTTLSEKLDLYEKDTQ